MIYFIVNESSRTGKGQQTWKKIREMLKNQQLEYKAYVTKYKGHARELAGKICASAEADTCLIVMGGDGTLNEVLNGMSNFDKVRLGLIPSGSGNDFARGLGISKDIDTTLKAILNDIEKGPESFKRIDIGKVSWIPESETEAEVEDPVESAGDKISATVSDNAEDSLDRTSTQATADKGAAERTVCHRHFGISSGIGMDAIVTKKVNTSKLKTFLNKLHIGNLTYVLLTIQTLFGMETMEADGEFFEPGKTKPRKDHKKKMIFLAAMNLPYEGGGVPMSPRATATDGMLSFSSASGIPKWRTFFCLPILIAAKHEKIKGFAVEDAKTLKLHLSKPAVLHADGEYLGMSREVTFSSQNGQVKLLGCP